jgi:hypothetical protein
LGLARQAPARQCAPVANLRNILWLPAHSTYSAPPDTMCLIFVYIQKLL